MSWNRDDDRGGRYNRGGDYYDRDRWGYWGYGNSGGGDRDRDRSYGGSYGGNPWRDRNERDYGRSANDRDRPEHFYDRDRSYGGGYGGSQGWTGGYGGYNSRDFSDRDRYVNADRDRDRSFGYKGGIFGGGQGDRLGIVSDYDDLRYGRSGGYGYGGDTNRGDQGSRRNYGEYGGGGPYRY